MKIRKIITFYKIILTKLKYNFTLKKLGKKVIIEKPILFLGKKYIEIEKGVFIRKNSRIEVIDNFNKKIFTPKLKIGKNVNIEQNFHCTCAGNITIGDNTSITENVSIFNIIHPYKNINIAPKFQDIEVKDISIGENCFIGANVVILPGSVIGKNVTIGSNSVVNKKTPDNVVIAGIPAKIIKKYNFKLEKWEKYNEKL